MYWANCAHLQAECRIKHAQYSLIIMIIKKYVKRMPICFARDRVCVFSIVSHFYCGSGVCWIDCLRVSYVQLTNQCGLYLGKIKIFFFKLVGVAYMQVSSIDRKLRYVNTFTKQYTTMSCIEPAALSVIVSTLSQRNTLLCLVLSQRPCL